MQAFIIQGSGYKIQDSGPDTLIIIPEKSIGIDEIRTINNFLAKKPMQSAKNIVYLKDAHLMTVFAQNALLKILEEPPGDSEIYLITDQPDLLLPTILSRVQISPIAHISHITPISPIGFNLDSLTTREQALDFLNGIEYYLHQNLNQKINYQTISETRKYLKANCNIKLCLNYFLMNLWKKQ